MLTALDETLRHQIATTFDHAGTSDHRFFDRYWFGVYDPRGRMALVCGMAQYLNTNVMDGFCAIQLPRADGGIEQHNFRLSRALRPDLDETRVGPLRVRIEEPFQRIRLGCEAGELPLSFDLEWTAFLPPSEEKHHFNRVNGRVFQDYHRYTQAGRGTGVVQLGDQVFDVDDWWAGRDHSWGVRSQVGGYEPATGPGTEAQLAAAGYVYYWLTFNDGECGGYVQLQFLGDRTRIFTDGEIVWPQTGRRFIVADAEVEVELHPGTRIYKRLRTRLRGYDGSTVELVAEPVIGYWSMDGTGYDWGWNDDKGLGFHRGEYVVEHDIYDITHPERVVRPNGELRIPGHREAPCAITVDGKLAPRSAGHQVFVASGPVKWLGLDK
ncbi:MAG: hypothetical protein IPJ33_03470 [Gammaproteobacteria bacterium]|nr:hypothetical protein [Gammaproteobacteria bacterium]MBK7727583.1 hypothetical protein [Gammaproteobacteria bacterium]MBK9665414.1 hypothetical protein [Gammaproteobacteria bacterium]MBP6050476.1 hypothetical protein [Pseudomonadales bacterium]